MWLNSIRKRVLLLICEEFTGLYIFLIEVFFSHPSLHVQLLIEYVAIHCCLIRIRKSFVLENGLRQGFYRLIGLIQHGLELNPLSHGRTCLLNIHRCYFLAVYGYIGRQII